MCTSRGPLASVQEATASSWVSTLSNSHPALPVQDRASGASDDVPTHPTTIWGYVIGLTEWRLSTPAQSLLLLPQYTHSHTSPVKHRQATFSSLTFTSGASHVVSNTPGDLPLYYSCFKISPWLYHISHCVHRGCISMSPYVFQKELLQLTFQLPRMNVCISKTQRIFYYKVHQQWTQFR